MSSILAIIGRPNVGKSSIFNRLVGRRKAIVVDVSGTTRDRHYADISYKQACFKLIDTGGIDLNAQDKMKKQVKKQAELAIQEADIILFICDAISGIAPLDIDIAEMVRKSGKKSILVVNKADNEKLAEAALDFYQLGLQRPFVVSAEYNRGIDELVEEIAKYLKPFVKKAQETPVKVAIAGRPNVGKSSFINCLLKEERVIVDEAAGTTRDAIDVHFKDDGRDYCLIDTAGMRHKKKIKEVVEFFGLSRTKESIRRADVVAFIMDAVEGITKDDLSILGFINEEGKPYCILVNKWDLVKGITTKEYENLIRHRLSFSVPAPVLFISCLLDKDVGRSFESLKLVLENSSRQIETSKLNKALEQYTKALTPPGRKGVRPKILYATQTGTKPPRFLVFAKHADLISDSYNKYLERRLSKDFSFEGAPIKIRYREKQ